MLVYVGGVNGVGKSTLISRLCEFGTGFYHLRGSALLMNELGIASGDYETLRSLPDETKDLAFGELVRKLAQNNDPNETLIIDAHFLNIVEGVTKKVIGSWITNVDAVILIEAEVESIHRRIVLDSSRGREFIALPNQDIITLYERYLAETKDEFLSIQERYNRPGIIVHNSENQLDQAAEQVRSFCNQFKSEINQNL